MQRLATGFALAAGLVAGLFLLPTWGWLALVTVASLGCSIELAALLRRSVPGSPGYLVPLTTALLIAAVLAEGALLPLSGEPLLATVVLVLPAIFALLTGRPERAWPTIGWVTFGAIYCAVPALAAFRLREDTGPWLVLLLLAVIGGGDTAAYYCGKRLGRRKLAPALSPKKTWAGSVGGASMALVLAAAWSWWRLERIDPALLLLAVITQAVGQFGDLLESAIKRTAGVKDSGSLLPGHGGFLDRADATLLATPVFVLGVRWFGNGWS